MMLSPGLRQVLESLPSRIPLAVELLDCELNVLAPEPGARSMPLLDFSEDLRRHLRASISSGRPQTTVQRGRRMTAFPVSVAGDRSCTAVLAVSADEAETALVDAWGPLLRAAVESDLAAVATTNRLLQQVRHLGAVLRFVQHLADATSEAEVLRATIQAGAVWFDLDARIYTRTASGEFAPHMYLPGAPVASPRSIPASIVDGIRDVLRVSSATDLDALGLSGESAVLIPIGGRKADLLLVLAGVLPSDVELTFGAISRVAAHLLDRARNRTAALVRKSLLMVLSDPTTTADQTLARALELIAELCHASSGSVTLHGREEPRVLASTGHATPSLLLPVADGEAHVTVEGDRMAVTLSAGRDRSLSVELEHAATGTFDLTARFAFERACEVLQAWLSGVSAMPEGRRALLGLSAEEPNTFLARIEQEIARAKRFNLNLALVVVRGRNPLDDPALVDDLLRNVRAELRDSDVLGAMSSAEIAALLIQTDSQGGQAVVRRLHKRLADEETSSAGPASVGHAVFSAECATAAALLSRARAADARAIAASAPGKD